jgi:sugar phosphate isomerase/epimerase
LGADHVLVVSDEADPAVLAPALERISDWCDGQIKPVLEFLRITAVGSLSQVQELLQAGGAHDFGILIDSLHLARSDEYDRLAELDRAMFPYIQLCDGRNECADDYDSLLADALDGRLAPGEGELPLQRLLEALPADLPLSLEVRSRHYRDAFSDPVARAKAVWHQTTEFLKRDGGLT